VLNKWIYFIGIKVYKKKEKRKESRNVVGIAPIYTQTKSSLLEENNLKKQGSE
jgi:hypothetical protein